MTTPDAPTIEYPCPWTYRVLCRDEGAVLSALMAIVGDAEHTLASEAAGRSGRYRRIELVVTVRDAPHRDALFEAIVHAPSVAFVL